MLQKIFWVIILLLIAVISAVFCANSYNICECTNASKICKVYSVNSVLKTKKHLKTVHTDSKRGTEWHILGVGRNDTKNLYCREYKYTAIKRDGTKENKVKYLLSNMSNETINEYTKLSPCEIDRVAIQAYLSSKNTEPLKYTFSGYWFRYLWYLVSALFVLFAFMVLFGEVISEEEAIRIRKNLITDEEGQKIYDKIDNVIQNIPKIDKLGAGIVNELERKFDKYSIDIKENKKDT